jgi:TolA-binding protein
MNARYRELVGALRQSVEQPVDAGEATRLRIHHSLARRARKRRVMVYALVAAGFVTSTALAFYVAHSTQHQGEPRHDTKRSGHELAQPSSARAPAPALPRLSAPPVSEAVRVIAKVDPAQPIASAASPTMPPAGRRLTRPRSVAKADPVPAPSPRPKLSPEQQQGLYVTAHRLHFRGSPQVALQAWDAYLASEPQGAPALEARYNRGVVLLRLGRNADARQALEPFARGSYGTLHQADALQLLARLP